MSSVLKKPFAWSLIRILVYSSSATDWFISSMKMCPSKVTTVVFVTSMNSLVVSFWSYTWTSTMMFIVSSAGISKSFPF